MQNIIADFVFIGKGIIFTLELLSGGIIIGFVLGTLLSILQYNKIASSIIKCFISVVRGTPLILQLSIFYFVVPAFTGIKLTIFTAGIITFGLNSSAYVAEILRAGIESVPAGQFEASKTLEISSFYMWKDIILPQVIKNIFPAMINEIIALLKETALISTIGGVDIMRSAQMLASQQFTYFLPLTLAAIYYYGLVLIIEYLGKKFEKKGAYDKNK